MCEEETGLGIQYVISKLQQWLSKQIRDVPGLVEDVGWMVHALDSYYKEHFLETNNKYIAAHTNCIADRCYDKFFPALQEMVKLRESRVRRIRDTPKKSSGELYAGEVARTLQFVKHARRLLKSSSEDVSSQLRDFISRFSMIDIMYELAVEAQLKHSNSRR